MSVKFYMFNNKNKNNYTKHIVFGNLDSFVLCMQNIGKVFENCLSYYYFFVILVKVVPEIWKREIIWDLSSQVYLYIKEILNLLLFLFYS